MWISSLFFIVGNWTIHHWTVDLVTFLQLATKSSNWWRPLHLLMTRAWFLRLWAWLWDWNISPIAKCKGGRKGQPNNARGKLNERSWEGKLLADKPTETQSNLRGQLDRMTTSVERRKPVPTKGKHVLSDQYQLHNVGACTKLISHWATWADFPGPNSLI